MITHRKVSLYKQTHRLRFRGVHECDAIDIHAVFSRGEPNKFNEINDENELSVIEWDLHAFRDGEPVKLTSKIFTAEEIEDIFQNERF